MPRDERTVAQLELVARIVWDKNNKANVFKVAQTVYDLGKIAKSLHKRYEAACNYAWACEEKYEKRTERLEAKAEELGKEIDVQVSHQRDPRGWPLIVKVGTYEHRLG